MQPISFIKTEQINSALSCSKLLRFFGIQKFFLRFAFNKLKIFFFKILMIELFVLNELTKLKLLRLKQKLKFRLV